MYQIEDILVLISTYNGEKYLKEQLDCILNQKDVNPYILIRDDGSSDSTVKILEEYSSKYSNITFYTGENLGFTYSFYNLLKKAHGFKYYALADQDDIWKEQKLSNAISKMSDQYIMYASNMDIVDEDLNFQKKLYCNYEYENNLLKVCFPFYNPFGCTIVWKDEVHQKIKKNLPQKRIPHDLWMHVASNFNGTIFIDENSYILHRIHDSNACGIAKGTLARLKKLKKFYLSDFRTTTDETLKIALDSFGDAKLSESQKKFINKILVYKKGLLNKLKLMRSKELLEVKLKKRIEFYFLILVNKF